MTLHVHPYDSDWVRDIRNGARDDYGNLPERKISDGAGNPCRHCLTMIPDGQEMLVVAARPFPETQPYAETGPVFFCAEDCAPYDGAGMPPCIEDGEDRLVKGYTADNRILYGTGAIVPWTDIADTCGTILSDAKVAFVDVRSSRNNCFTFRVSRGEDAKL